MFRETRPEPPSLAPFEQAWTLTLPILPSAPASMDHERVYVPLRMERLIALDRENGILKWSRDIDIASAVAAGEGALFLATGKAIRALEATNGNDRWSFPLDRRLVAPLVWEAGWLLAVTDADELLALRSADGHLVWRQPLGGSTSHPVTVGSDAVYASLGDGRVTAMSLETGAPLWERQLPGTLSAPSSGRDRVFVGSTDNFFYALDARTGRDAWKWRNGGDVVGADVDGDLVFFASLDNVLRAVNRGNGNQKWRKPTGTRPVLPPRAFRGLVVVPGLMPAVTVFHGETGEELGEHMAAGDLIGPPLIDTALTPRRVTCVTMTREGVIEGLRSVELMFREQANAAITALPGRALAREQRQAH